MGGLTERAAREQLVRLGRALYDRGVTPGRTGNLSVRVDDGFVVTPTGSCLGRLRADRLSGLDHAGRHRTGDPPTKELALHLALHDRDPAARAVAHVHSTHAVAVSCMADVDPLDVLPPLTAYYVMRVGRLPLVPYFPPGDPGLAAAVADVHGRCALLANHGSIAAAPDLEAAMDAVEEIEETARLFLLLAGRATRPLTPGQRAELGGR